MAHYAPFYSIPGHTPANKLEQNLNWSVYLTHNLGICPEKFSFISPVISEICLNKLLFHSKSGHTRANMSNKNLYWVCLPGP